MVFWEVSFRIKYEYPYAKISENYPGSRISMWCIWNAEIIEVPDSQEEMMSEIEKLVKGYDLTSQEHLWSNGNFVLQLRCSCSTFPNVWDIMHQHDCFPVHPAYFVDGWSYYRMVSTSEENIRRFIESIKVLGSAELTRKRTAYGDTVPPSGWMRNFISSMTGMQRKSIEKAYDLGYFSTPRKVNVSEVAHNLGIGRSTCEEHLREAENRIMTEIMPLLKLTRTHEEISSKSTNVR